MTEIAKKRIGLSGACLKWIAIVCMAIDHIGASVVEQYFYQCRDLYWAGMMSYDRIMTVYRIYLVIRCIGRFSFPVYCFLLVEGFRHTRSRAKYLRNLVIFAVLSELPFDLAFYGTFFYWEHQNVFMTLALGLAALWLIELLRQRTEPWLSKKGLPEMGRGLLSILGDVIIVAPVAYLAYLMNTDYDATGILVIYVFYLLYHRRVLASVCSAAVLTLFSSTLEIFCFPSIAAIGLYNGSRGKQLKYFFYIFYPLHLLILYGVRVMLHFI